MLVIARWRLSVASVLLLGGCFEAPALPTKRVDRVDLPGVYGVTYAGVEQWLVLRADETYEQRLVVRGGEPLRHRGHWQLSDDRESLYLEDPIVMKKDPFTTEPPRRIKGVWAIKPFRPLTSRKVFLLISSDAGLAFEKRDWKDVPAALSLATEGTSSG